MKVDRFQIIRNIRLDLNNIKPNKFAPLDASKMVKDGFPIPSPSGEDEQTYISNCISQIIDEYPEEGQAYAICKAEWDK